MDDNDSYQTFMPLADLPPGSQRIVMAADGRAIALFHLLAADDTPGAGGVNALDNRCVHRGGSIGDGQVADGRVICPWHEWTYRVDDGRCVDNPQARLTSYPVRIHQGAIEVAVGPDRLAAAGSLAAGPAQEGVADVQH